MCSQVISQLSQNLSQGAILTYLCLQEDPNLTIQQLATILNRSERSIRDYLRELRDAGLLQNSAYVSLLGGSFKNNIGNISPNCTSGLPQNIIDTCNRVANQFFAGIPDINTRLQDMVSSLWNPEYPMDPIIIWDAARVACSAFNDRTREEPVRGLLRYMYGVMRNMYQEQIAEEVCKGASAREEIAAASEEVDSAEEDSARELQGACFGPAALKAFLDRVIQIIVKQFPDAKPWLLKLRPIKIARGILYLRASDNFTKQWVEARWGRIISNVLARFRLQFQLLAPTTDDGGSLRINDA